MLPSWRIAPHFDRSLHSHLSLGTSMSEDPTSNIWREWDDARHRVWGPMNSGWTKEVDVGVVHATSFYGFIAFLATLHPYGGGSRGRGKYNALIWLLLRWLFLVMGWKIKWVRWGVGFASVPKPCVRHGRGGIWLPLFSRWACANAMTWSG